LETVDLSEILSQKFADEPVAGLVPVAIVYDGNGLAFCDGGLNKRVNTLDTLDPSCCAQLHFFRADFLGTKEKNFPIDDLFPSQCQNALCDPLRARFSFRAYLGQSFSCAVRIIPLTSTVLQLFVVNA
jgi:hypothetical protein